MAQWRHFRHYRNPQSDQTCHQRVPGTANSDAKFGPKSHRYLRGYQLMYACAAHCNRVYGGGDKQPIPTMEQQLADPAFYKLVYNYAQGVIARAQLQFIGETMKQVVSDSLDELCALESPGVVNS
jgi:hypothetical protein